MAEQKLYHRYARPTPLRFALWMVFAFLVLSLDQATKFWAERTFSPGEPIEVLPFFNLVIAHNRGAAFSFLAQAGGWQQWFFAAVALVVTAVTLRLVWRHSSKKLFALSLTLIAAGAVGNLIDRMTLGYVIDFLDFHWAGWHWPAFNVADIAICCGAAGVVLDELLGVSRDR